MDVRFLFCKRKWTVILIIFLFPTGLATKFYNGPGSAWVHHDLGGLLYVIFWGLVVFLFFPGVAVFKICLWVFLATCGIEFLQLWHPDFLETVRNNFFGRTLLGTTFMWTDFWYYSLGFLLCFLLLKVLKKRESKSCNEGGCRMKKTLLLTAIVLMLAVLSCAPGTNPSTHTPDKSGDVAGFWLGLWHGFIVMFSYIISLFSDQTTVYEVHNNGGWYNLGFLLGVACFFGGSGGGAGRRSRCD